MIDDTMKATIKRLGNGANGALRLEVILPESTCAMDTRGRIRVALRALPEMPAAGATYRLGDCREIGRENGGTRYAVEIVPKTGLETRGGTRKAIPTRKATQGHKGRNLAEYCDILYRACDTWPQASKAQMAAYDTASRADAHAHAVHDARANSRKAQALRGKAQALRDKAQAYLRLAARYTDNALALEYGRASVAPQSKAAARFSRLLVARVQAAQRARDAQLAQLVAAQRDALAAGNVAEYRAVSDKIAALIAG